MNLLRLNVCKNKSFVIDWISLTDLQAKISFWLNSNKVKGIAHKIRKYCILSLL